MPKGIPKRYMKCNKCPGEKFKDYSQLRKHQWSFHREMFDNLVAAARTVAPTNAERERNRARTAKARATRLAMRAATTEISVREFIDAPTTNGAREMTVSQLLGELSSRHKFIGNMIASIAGIHSQYKEAAAHE